MQLRPLTWKYIGADQGHWQGIADGLLSHVSFLVELSASDKTYSVRANIPGLEAMGCIDLEAAKTAAQELLTGYALSLTFY